MKFGRTERGFEYIEFVDRNGVACSLQQSSAIDFDVAGADEHPGSSCIWLGLDGDGLSQTRMHLSYAQVAELNARLDAWLETGRLGLKSDSQGQVKDVDEPDEDEVDMDNVENPADVEEAIEVIKLKMREDLDFAWTWQCNIAAFFIDEGGSHRAANQAAARFMKLAFDVDVTKIEHWAGFEKQWKESQFVGSKWLVSIGGRQDRDKVVFDDWLVFSCDWGCWTVYSHRSSHLHKLVEVNTCDDVIQLFDSLKVSYANEGCRPCDPPQAERAPRFQPSIEYVGIHDAI